MLQNQGSDIMGLLEYEVELAAVQHEGCRRYPPEGMSGRYVRDSMGRWTESRKGIREGVFTSTVPGDPMEVVLKISFKHCILVARQQCCVFVQGMIDNLIPS
jgi:hypothetical protein